MSLKNTSFMSEFIKNDGRYTPKTLLNAVTIRDAWFWLGCIPRLRVAPRVSRAVSLTTVAVFTSRFYRFITIYFNYTTRNDYAASRGVFDRKRTQLATPYHERTNERTPLNDLVRHYHATEMRQRDSVSGRMTGSGSQSTRLHTPCYPCSRRCCRATSLRVFSSSSRLH